MKLKHLYLNLLIVLLFFGGIVIFPIRGVQANPDTLTLRPNAVGTYSQFVEVANSGFLFGDQFESGSYARWTGHVGTELFETTIVHSGTYALNTSTTANDYVYQTVAATAQLNVRFYVYFPTMVPTANANQNGILVIAASAGVTPYLDMYNASGTLELALFDTNNNHVFTSGLSLGQWYCIEIQCVQGGGATGIKLYVNGVNAANGTASATANYTRATVGGISKNSGVVPTYTDDVVVSNSYIGIENRPALVNDSSDNTALQVTANTTQEETELLATTSQTGTINSVTVDMRAEASTISLQAVTVTRTHSTDYEGSATTISNTAFTDYTTVYSTNPNTGVPWTWAEVNALEVGARASTLSSGTIQFSKFYIIVDYQSDVTPPTYSSISTNTTLANNPCSFNCLVSDDTNVSTYIFSTNNTGTWTNDTATTFVDFFNMTAAWANVTKTLNDTVGNVVSYLWYANDTSNNWSSSDRYDLILTAPYRPSLQMAPDNVTCRIYLETFSVQINVTNAVDTQAFNFTIYYDPQVLNCSSVNWGELGTGTMTEIDTTNGILEGNVAGTPLNGNHWLLSITFQAINATIWKEGLANKLEGKIWFHQALLGFVDGSTLQYVKGGINQIDVNQAAYTFLPIQGDVNNDGTVDVLDLRIIAFYYGKTPADPEWPAASKYDLTNDNTIDIFDLRVVAANIGFTYP